ncbi:MAG: 3-oxoacyl-ACP reductase FabG [Lentisphaerae bacterium]|nr:3-oxoacyl-ACP reductase FabG [Lentisphaerota bacterium]
MKYDFSGQVALVTGGTRGIGAAVSSALLQAGANVIATYAGNRAAAEEFAAAQGDLRNRLELHCFDVSDYAAVETFFRQFDLKHDRLDILVNSAGIRQDAVVAMLPEEQWQRVLAVNLNGAFNMAKMSVLRMMRNRYGRIILLSSPIGRLGFAGQANYAASKAGLEALCKSLCKEVAKRKITVNCVSPGFIDTDFISNLPPEQSKEYQQMVPLRRFGTPAEVANAVLFLATQEAEYISGSVLEISGGL